MDQSANDVSFNKVPNYSPKDLNQVGIRRSPRLAQLHNKKQLELILNHMAFFHASQALIPTTKVSEGDTKCVEEEDPFKEIHTFKEEMSSPYKNQFLQAIENEVKKHVEQNHWMCRPRDDGCED